MARITPISPVRYIQGKLAKSDSSVFRVVNGTNYCANYTKFSDPANGTDAQKANLTAFRTTAAAVKTALADSTQKAEYEAQFAAQKRYKTLYGFVFAKLYPGV